MQHDWCRTDLQGADRYISCFDPIFVPAFVLSQPSFKVKWAHILGQTFISQNFTEEHYWYPNAQVLFLKGACMYVLLRLSPFELILNQI